MRSAMSAGSSPVANNKSSIYSSALFHSFFFVALSNPFAFFLAKLIAFTAPSFVFSMGWFAKFHKLDPTYGKTPTNLDVGIRPPTKEAPISLAISVPTSPGAKCVAAAAPAAPKVVADPSCHQYSKGLSFLCFAISLTIDPAKERALKSKFLVELLNLSSTAWCHDRP